jgi:hypothetical protein
VEDEARSTNSDELRVAALGAVQDDLTAPLLSATVIGSAEGVTTFAGLGDDSAARDRMEKELAAVAKHFPSTFLGDSAEEPNGSSE